MGILSALLAAAAAEQDPVGQADQAIIDGVGNALFFDGWIRSETIDVSAKKGIVTLSGQVHSAEAKKRAARVAETRKGVLSVVNQLEVEPKNIPDAQIQSSVNWVLADNESTGHSGIEGQVNDGIVRLTGETASFDLRRLAEEAVESVSGVRGVINDIKMNLEPRSDEAIERHIRMKLRHTPWVEGGLVNISCNQGVVTLAGTVDSLHELMRLDEAAHVSGVKEVSTADVVIDIGILEKSERFRKPDPTDPEIREALDLALEADPRIRAETVKVAVQGGVVSLNGTVSNLKAKQAAEMDARNTAGVSYVYNFIRVEPEEPVDDAALAEKATRLLRADAELGDDDVRVSVDDGTVTLRGKVDDKHEWLRAPNLVSGAAGVREVVNRLWVDWDVPPAYRD